MTDIREVERLDRMTIKRLSQLYLALTFKASYTADEKNRQSLFSKAQQCCDEIKRRRTIRKVVSHGN